MKLTIGMPHYADFDGAVLRSRRWRLIALGDVEILVVDSDAAGKHGQAIKQFIGNCGRPDIRYVAMPENLGPAAARIAFSPRPAARPCCALTATCCSIRASSSA